MLVFIQLEQIFLDTVQLVIIVLQVLMHLYHVVQDHIQKLVNLILLVNFVTEESIVLDMQCLRQILYQ
jgi:hypothetical protein